MPLDPLIAAFIAVEENAKLLKGPKGDDGDTIVGPVGPEGKAGLDGAPGRDGVDGKASDGRDGTDGTDGEDGESIVWRGPWRSGVRYDTQDAVEFEGSSYIATRPTTAKPPKGGWDLMAQKGRDGSPGRGYVPRGGGGGGSGGSDLTILDEGVPLDTAVTSIDFTGTGVTATNVGHAVTVDISGGGSGLPAGGTEGQALIKQSGVDGDADWGRRDFDYIQQDDPGAVGAGKSWVQLPPLIDPDPWDNFADSDVILGQRTQPTTPNGHYYVVDNPGHTDVVEPDPWPTDGSSVVDGTASWADFGLIADAVFDSQLFPVYLRNDDDSAWLQVSAGDIIDGHTDGGERAFRSFRPDGTLGAEMLWGIDDAKVQFKVYDNGGNFVSGVVVDENGVDLNARDVLTFKVGITAIRLFVGETVDPSAGAGVEANLMSLYTRDNAGTGELWFKTGAADTDWTQVV